MSLSCASKIFSFSISNSTSFCCSNHSPVRMRENTDQKKLRILTVFSECFSGKHFLDLDTFEEKAFEYMDDDSKEFSTMF